MTIKTNRDHQDLEASGDDELTLATVRYTGDRSVYNASALRQQGGWPANSPLNRDVREIALIPSKRLGYWESHADMEIAYDAETLAEALLDKNYLAPQVFGANVNVSLRDRVLDHLGINVQRNAEAYREELADVAGAGVEPGEEADPHEARESEFADVKRSTLQEAAAAHGMSDTDAAGREELTDYLADQDDDAVDATIDSLQSGEGVPDDADSSGSDAGGQDGPLDKALTSLDGVGDATADELRERGHESVADVADADPADLAAIDGISESGAEDLKAQASGED